MDNPRQRFPDAFAGSQFDCCEDASRWRGVTAPGAGVARCTDRRVRLAPGRCLLNDRAEGGEWLSLLRLP